MSGTPESQGATSPSSDRRRRALDSGQFLNQRTLVTKLRSKLVIVFATAVVAAAVAGITATPASAWYSGRAYIVIGNWNCVGGGTVKGVYGAVDNTWTDGDWNDKVR